MTDIPLQFNLPRQPKKGDMVRFVLDGGNHTGETRPAIVTSLGDEQRGLLNLHVFTEPDDYEYKYKYAPCFRGDVHYCNLLPRHIHGTWFWPEDEDLIPVSGIGVSGWGNPGQPAGVEA